MDLIMYAMLFLMADRDTAQRYSIFTKSDCLGKRKNSSSSKTQ